MITKPNISDVFLKEGIELQQRGKLLWTCCPLHQERTASFCVDPEKQRFKCFGCHTSGDVIDFVMKYRGLSFHDTLKHLGILSGDTIRAKPDKLELKKQKLLRKFRRWEQLYRRALSELVRLGNRVDLQVTSPEQLALPGINEMYLKKFTYEYYLSILNSGNDEQKFQLYKEVMNADN